MDVALIALHRRWDPSARRPGTGASVEKWLRPWAVLLGVREGDWSALHASTAAVEGHPVLLHLAAVVGAAEDMSSGGHRAPAAARGALGGEQESAAAAAAVAAADGGDMLAAGRHLLHRMGRDRDDTFNETCALIPAELSGDGGAILDNGPPPSLAALREEVDALEAARGMLSHSAAGEGEELLLNFRRLKASWAAEDDAAEEARRSLGATVEESRGVLRRGRETFDNMLAGPVRNVLSRPEPETGQGSLDEAIQQAQPAVAAFQRLAKALAKAREAAAIIGASKSSASKGGRGGGARWSSPAGVEAAGMTVAVDANGGETDSRMDQMSGVEGGEILGNAAHAAKLRDLTARLEEWATVVNSRDGGLGGAASMRA